MYVPVHVYVYTCIAVHVHAYSLRVYFDLPYQCTMQVIQERHINFTCILITVASFPDHAVGPNEAMITAVHAPN